MVASLHAVVSREWSVVPNGIRLVVPRPLGSVEIRIILRARNDKRNHSPLTTHHGYNRYPDSSTPGLELREKNVFFRGGKHGMPATRGAGPGGRPGRNRRHHQPNLHSS